MSAGPTRLRQRPPTVVRTDVPTIEGRRSRARRRALRLRRWLLVGVPLLLVVALATAAWLVLASSAFAVSSVRVTGTHRLTVAQVQQAAGIATGRPLARVDVAGAEQRVAQLPVVKSVTVTRDWPHTVVIAVVERVPVAAAQTVGGWALLDADGVQVGLSSTRPTSLVTLYLDPATTPEATLRAASAVAAALPSGLRSKVDYVTADSQDSVRLQLAGGAVVRWGSAQDSATKARVLAALLPHHAHVYDVTAPGFATTS